MQPELIEVVIGFPARSADGIPIGARQHAVEFELAKIHSFGDVSSYSVYIVTLFLSSF